MKVYMDNGATTKVDPEVLEKMKKYFSEEYGNPSSLHSYGINAEDALDEARMKIANTLEVSPEEIVFTSGGTESNNFALKGIAFKHKKGHIITTKIEHDCILNTCKWLEKQGSDITYLDVDSEGFVNLKDIEENIRDDTILVSIIHGNNEVGTIQDMKSIWEICNSKGVLFHTDACQSYTKVPINGKYADLITINSHKIHGPKGVGALYIRKGVDIEPLLHGGGHERSFRSGTENVPGIVGFAEAAFIGIRDMEKNVSKMIKLRDYMISKLLEIPNTRLNGPKGSKRLANNINITFDYVEGEALVMRLDMYGIAVSTGSACSSKKLEPSHVLSAMGRRPEEAHGSLRFTLSKYTTKEEVDYVVEKVKEVVGKLRELSPLTKRYR